ncbi:MAG: HDOD domain-containing protein [Deltaproteobacteria bacterium]|nr:HDOD domain-containing protein [Deltaproteobacteria bacterium]
MKLAGSVLEELWFAEDDSKDVTEEASQSMAAKMAEINGLKPFPVVAQRILGILSNPDFRVVEVTNALEEDPALAAGIMRMANSAFFAGSKACASVQQAFVRLGAKSVREVVASVATMGMFPDVSGLGKQIRDHCAATAAIVQVLARDFTPKQTEGIFLSGLMHDVAKLLLIESEEIVYSSDNVEETLTPDRIHIDERHMLGYDHAVLGGHVLTLWKMPEPIPKVVAWHHQPTRAYEVDDIGPMIAILRIADQLDGIMRTHPHDYEESLEKLATNSDCTYVHINARDLIDRWDTLYNIRADSLKFFGS